MPIYEYECSNCRYYLEVIQKISDAKLRKCPSCGKNALKKLISAPVFRLKGSGWYETDFKGDQDKRRNLAGAEKEPPGEAKDAKDAKDGKDAKGAGAADSSADSKADTKADAKGDTGDKPAAKGEPKADKPQAARGKDHKSKSSKPSPKAKPAPKRAAAKPPSKAVKRRGRR